MSLTKVPDEICSYLQIIRDFVCICDVKRVL